MEGITYDEFKEILKMTLKEDEFEYIMGLWSDDEE